MKEKEKELFKSLCKFNEEFNNSSLTEYATPSVLGYLFFNRMQGVAYDTLKKNNLLGQINREFRTSLASAYEQNVQKNESFKKCVNMLSEILSHCNCKVAMLKGAYLCIHYPAGYRTANDVDLLILPKDVTTIGNLLSKAGFEQGSIKNGNFIPATRQEIIESKMMRGETVPYIKEVNLPFMKFFEVDLNFSLDYKNNNDNTLEKMLSSICVKKEKGINIPTLSDEDFFIHLCAHLYKEATTLPWIEMNRDMTLYKYCDIYLLLSEITEKQIENIFSRAKELNMEKICGYSVLETMSLFDISNPMAYAFSRAALDNNSNFCQKVISPKDKKIFMYQTKNTTERFFLESRITDLKEVDQNETT